MRDRLAEDAGYALWLVIVVREACGLNSTRGDADLQGPQRGLCLHGAIRHVSPELSQRVQRLRRLPPGVLADRIPAKSPNPIRASSRATISGGPRQG